jgi:hypothetical protein
MSDAANIREGRTMRVIIKKSTERLFHPHTIGPMKPSEPVDDDHVAIDLEPEVHKAVADRTVGAETFEDTLIRILTEPTMRNIQ